MENARPFEILPAIDLRRGRVVRLRKGDFTRETTYSDDPQDVARQFVEAGARWLHVVDLDGAREGQPVQGHVIDGILAATRDRTHVEVAGGLRTAGAVAAVLAGGAARAVVGTAAVQDPSWAGDLVALHGADRIAVAIDVRNGRAFGDGWSSEARGVDLEAAVAELADAGVRWFEVTAIERDGGLEGPDLPLYQRLVRLAEPGRCRLVASGGIASLDDLQALNDLGAAGAIVGRAFYEGRIRLEDALTLS